ncbi:MAG: MFS transporter [Gammaproteobacteria bacterium]|nr:MFS transporter [Gammaproteobacteria bacterium]
MRLLKQPVLNVQGEHYLVMLIIIAPLLNFLSGISIDLYAPSLPAIMNHFHTSMMLVKNTITVTMIGFAIGCIFFGALIDIIGRRKTILFGLSLFIAFSIAAIGARSINELMFIRFIQGIMISTASIGARALVVDNFTGKRFNIAIVYTSVTYASGPVIAPFVGGILQYHFGWKANFIAYAFFGFILIAAFGLFVREKSRTIQRFSLTHVLKQYQKILSNKTFILGAAILGTVFIEQMIYPILGPFIIENTLHHTSITYGNTALLVGSSYLVGTLTNRMLLGRFSPQQLVQIGFTILILGTLIQLFFAIFLPLSLLTFILPIAVIDFSLGFIFSNILGACLKLFPENVGIASAVQICFLMIVGAIGTLMISHFNIVHLLGLTIIYLIVVILQLMLFFTFRYFL